VNRCWSTDRSLCRLCASRDGILPEGLRKGGQKVVELRLHHLVQRTINMASQPRLWSVRCGQGAISAYEFPNCVSPGLLYFRVGCFSGREGILVYSPTQRSRHPLCVYTGRYEFLFCSNADLTRSLVPRSAHQFWCRFRMCPSVSCQSLLPWCFLCGVKALSVDFIHFYSMFQLLPCLCTFGFCFGLSLDNLSTPSMMAPAMLGACKPCLLAQLSHSLHKQANCTVCL
jgi:hypothetical protein